MSKEMVLDLVGQPLWLHSGMDYGAGRNRSCHVRVDSEDRGARGVSPLHLIHLGWFRSSLGDAAHATKLQTLLVLDFFYNLVGTAIIAVTRFHAPGVVIDVVSPCNLLAVSAWLATQTSKRVDAVAVGHENGATVTISSLSDGVGILAAHTVRTDRKPCDKWSMIAQA